MSHNLFILYSMPLLPGTAPKMQFERMRVVYIPFYIYRSPTPFFVP